MISRFHRLNKSRVAVVKSQGKTLKTGFFTLVFSPSFDAKAHFAVVVSKKISPKAVIRNQLRRRYYSLARQFQQAAQSILIIPHQDILKHPAAIVAADLTKHLAALCLKK